MTVAALYALHACSTISALLAAARDLRRGARSRCWVIHCAPRRLRAASHAAASRHSVSRCSGRKNPKCPIFARADRRGADVDALRRRAGEPRAQQVDRRRGRPRIVGQADRAQRAAIAREILQRLRASRRRRNSAASSPSRSIRGTRRAAGPRRCRAGPACSRASRAIGAPISRSISVDAIFLGRMEQPPVAGLRGDEQRARNLGVVRREADRLSAERVADHRERQLRPHLRMWSIAAATSSAAQSRMRTVKPRSEAGREPPVPR